MVHFGDASVAKRAVVRARWLESVALSTHFVRLWSLRVVVEGNGLGGTAPDLSSSP